eukprot:3391802-Prymnesium_polylepis.1
MRGCVRLVWISAAGAACSACKHGYTGESSRRATGLPMWALTFRVWCAFCGRGVFVRCRSS